MLRGSPGAFRSALRFLSTEPSVAPQTRTKRKVTPYMAFMTASLKGTTGQRTPVVMKAFAAEWKVLSEEERAKYIAKAEELNTNLPQVPLKPRTECAKKRKLNAYTAFMMLNMKGKDGSDTLKACAAEWKTLSDQERSQFRLKAEVLNIDRPLTVHLKTQRFGFIHGFNVFVKERNRPGEVEDLTDRMRALGTAWKALRPDAQQPYRDAAIAENAKRRVRQICSHRQIQPQGLSAFNMFMKERYSSVTEGNHSERLKKLHQAWKALFPEDRQRYKEAAVAENFKRGMEAANKLAPPSPSPQPAS